jgi:ABC-2 type transport system permease protein
LKNLSIRGLLDMNEKLNSKIRRIWAIGSKDLVDAFKNRTTLGILVTALAFVVLYRFLPQLEASDILPRLALYDSGQSEWVAGWDVQPEFDLIEMESQDGTERYVAGQSIPVLGLILPQDFDQTISGGGGVTLEGYMAHWLPEKDVEGTRSFFEGKLSESLGQSLRVELTLVYSRSDSRGYPWMAGVALIFSLAMGGIYVIPHLMLEEKQTRTMDTLLVSPATYAELVAGKALAGGVLAGLAGVIALLANSVLIQHWWVAILACASGTLFVVSVGLLLGSVVESKQQLTLWGFLIITIMLVPALLSILSLLLNDGIRTALRWTPSLSLLNLARSSFSEHVTFQSIGLDLAVVLGWTLVLYTLIIVVLRRSEGRHG